MIRKTGILLFLFFVAGCGGAPQSPHIYVIGVDCSQSFWNAGLTAEKRFVNLPRNKAIEVSNRLRENLNELNIVMEDNNFIQQSPARSTAFVKTIDKETLRKDLDSAIDMAAMLGSSHDEGKSYAVAKIRDAMNSFQQALDRHNFVKTADLPVGRTRIDEEINPASLQRVHSLLAHIAATMSVFTYTVNVPDQPQLLRGMGNDINGLMKAIENKINEENQRPIDEQWVRSGVYGKIKSLQYLCCFRIGDDASTVYKPAIGDMYDMVNRLVESSAHNGLTVFSRASNYESFFLRSFRELGNLISDWGNFDRDMGIKVTFIVIGDGKNDPDGQFESSGNYNNKLIAPLKEVFATKGEGGDSFISGLSWDSISEVNIKFCVPQRRYNTDLLDAWTRELQGVGKEGKIQVHYYMFENLHDKNGQYMPDAIDNLLE
jgi:hypothetical protein